MHLFSFVKFSVRQFVKYGKYLKKMTFLKLKTSTKQTKTCIRGEMCSKEI